MPETVDAVAAYLAEAKRAADTGPVVDARPLVAALEAVLAQHQPGRIVIFGSLCPRHAEHRYFSITSTEAADVVTCQDCTATVFSSCTGCGPPVSLESCPARKAISAELFGDTAPSGDGATAPPSAEVPSVEAKIVHATPAQVAAAQLLTEHGGCGEHGAAVRKIAGARDTAATQEG